MNHKINISTIAITGILVFTSFLFHELAHYLMGTVLGYDMILTLNSVNSQEGVTVTNTHRQLVSAAGPVFTIITAIIAYIFLKRRNHTYVYILLFMAFFMRMAAAAVSFYSPNDEARISQALGLGKMTLPLIITLFLLILVFTAARKHNYNWKFNLVLFFIVSVFTGLLVYTDQSIIKPWVYG